MGGEVKTMIAVCMIGVVVAIVCGNNGEWGAVAAVAVFVGIVCLLSCECRKSAKAYVNARNWWAKGGPER